MAVFVAVMLKYDKFINKDILYRIKRGVDNVSEKKESLSKKVSEKENVTTKDTVTGLDEMIINLKLELSRLNRDKSHLVLDKSLMLYFVFLFVGVLGFVNGYLSGTFLQILVYFGICVLVIGLVPYVMTMKKESDRMNELVEAMEHAYRKHASNKDR